MSDGDEVVHAISMDPKSEALKSLPCRWMDDDMAHTEAWGKMPKGGTMCMTFGKYAPALYKSGVRATHHGDDTSVWAT